MRHFTLLWLALAPLACGCMVPAYQHPAGFSSTYFRHLHAAQPIPPVAMWQDPVPVPVAPPPSFAPEESVDPEIVHPLLID